MPKGSGSNHKSQRWSTWGMTALELLVAMAITGFLLIAVAMFFQTSGKLFQQSGSRAETQQVVRLAAQRIAEEVRNADAVWLSDAVTGTDIEYYEDENRLMRSEDGAEQSATNEGLQDDGLVFRFTEVNGAYYLQFNITATDGYTIESKVLLNNILTEPGTLDTDRRCLRFTKP